MRLRALDVLVAATQNPQARDLDRAQGFLPFAALQPIFAVAQKSEVAIFHPGEQGQRLVEIFRVEMPAHGTQFLRRLTGGRAHLGPVGASDPHIAHAALDLRRERRECGRVDDSVDLDVLKRFQPRPAGLARRLRLVAGLAALAQGEQLAAAVARHRKDGVRQKMQGEGALGQREVDGIHEKGHVVVHHLDDGVRRGVAMLAQGGIEHPDQRGAPPPPCELQMRERDAGELGRIARREIPRVDIRVVRLEEAQPIQVAHGFGWFDGGSRDSGYNLAELFRGSLIHNGDPCC